MGEDTSERNVWEEERPRSHICMMQLIHLSTTHLAKPPDLEHAQLFPLAEERSHGGNGLEPKTGKGRKKKCWIKRSKQWLGRCFLWWGGGSPCPRNTRSSASCDRGIPVDFISFTKASFRVGGGTASLDRMGCDTQQRALRWWYLSLKTRQNKNELRSPSPGFYAAGWHRTFLQTSLWARGLSSHSVYTCRGGKDRKTGKRNQLRSMLSGHSHVIVFSERVGLKKQARMWRHWSGRGTVAAQFARARIIELLLARLGSNREGTVESLCLSRATLKHRLQWTKVRFSPRMPFWVIHYNYTNNADLGFTAQRKTDQVSIVWAN